MRVVSDCLVISAAVVCTCSVVWKETAICGVHVTFSNDCDGQLAVRVGFIKTIYLGQVHVILVASPGASDLSWDETASVSSIWDGFWLGSWLSAIFLRGTSLRVLFITNS